MTSQTQQTPGQGGPRIPSPAPQGALTRPVLVQALVFLTFGLITVFLQEPSLVAASVLLALYLLALGASSYYFSRSLGLDDSALGRALASLGLVLMAAGGLLLVLQPHAFPLALISSLALGVTGLFKLLAAGRPSAGFLARDWRLEGIVLMLSALGLPLLTDLGAKALLGTAGASALVAGIFGLIGALSPGGKKS